MKSQTIYYSAYEIFKVGNPKMQVIGYNKENSTEIDPNIPKLDEKYHFQLDFIRTMCAFLTNPKGDALFITGPTGSGKTSGVLQVAARLFWPVQQITANAKLEICDLVGSFTLQSEVKGGPAVTKFIYGPLSTAMREGHILLINEIDSMDPSELIGLNDVFDGKPLIISQNGGEIIYPHPMFRIIVTGNTVGGGDSSGIYQGTVLQNIAFLDRFRFVRVSYMAPEEEIKLIADQVPLNVDIIEKMVNLANSVRSLFLGSGNEEQSIRTTLSTRTLLRWALLTVNFKGAPNSVLYALNSSLLIRTPLIDKEVIFRLSKDYGLVAGDTDLNSL